MTKDEFIKNIDVNSLLKFLIHLSLCKVSWIELPWRAESHLKTGSKPEKEKRKKHWRKQHPLPRLVTLLSILSLSYLFFLFHFTYFKKRHSVCARGKQETRKQKQNKKNNMIECSICNTISPSWRIFFLLFFLFMQKVFFFYWFRVFWIIHGTFAPQLGSPIAPHSEGSP